MFAATLLLLAVDFDSLGRAEFRAGNYRTARKHFEKQMPLVTDQPEARARLLANLAQTYCSLGEISRAKKAIAEASAILPDDARLLHLRGQILFTARRYPEAEAAFEKARALADPSLSATALGDLSLLLQARNEHARAVRLLEQGVASVPAGQARARLLANLGVLKFKTGAKQDAARFLEQALAEAEAAVGPHHPDIAKIAEDYAAVLEKTGRRKEAKSYSQRAEAIQTAFIAQTNSTQVTVDKSDLK